MKLSAYPELNLPGLIDPGVWLAQATLDKSALTTVVVGVLVFILIGVAAVLAAKKFSSQFSDDYKGQIFSLQQLREMHRIGKLTDEEFEKAKRLVVDAELAAHDMGSRRADASDETGEISFGDADFEVEDNQHRNDPAHRVVKTNLGPKRNDPNSQRPESDESAEARKRDAADKTQTDGNGNSDKEDRDPEDDQDTVDRPPRRP